jgi:hypothetical protein
LCETSVIIALIGDFDSHGFRHDQSLLIHLNEKPLSK